MTVFFDKMKPNEPKEPHNKHPKPKVKNPQKPPKRSLLSLDFARSMFLNHSRHLIGWPSPLGILLVVSIGLRMVAVAGVGPLPANLALRGGGEGRAGSVQPLTTD